MTFKRADTLRDLARINCKRTLLAVLLGTGLAAAEGLAGDNMKTLDLPKPKMEGGVAIETALQKRRSNRKYRPDPVKLADVSQLLWAAQGISDKREGLRTAPSAGALYPLELYLVAGNIEGLPSGVYRYQPHDHALTKTGDGDRRRKLAKVTFDQSWIEDAAGIFVFSAVPERTTRKYGKRGIRYIHMEAGHASQNVFLQAVSLGLGTVVVGAFEDDDVRSVVGLEEDPLYLMPFGRPAD